MGVADIGDHGHVGPHHLPQVADFAKVVHSGLNNRRLVLRAQAQQSQGRADVVVEVLRRFQAAVFGPQYGGNHLLGGRLAHAAGDLDKGDLEFVPVGGRQGLQGQPGVVHLDIKFIAPQFFGQSGAQTSGCAALQRRVDEVVSVKLFPHPGDEQAAGALLPAVRGDSGYHGYFRLWILPDAMDGGGDLSYGHGLHEINLFSSNDRTAVRSPHTADCMSFRWPGLPWGPGCWPSCRAGS